MVYTKIGFLFLSYVISPPMAFSQSEDLGPDVCLNRDFSPEFGPVRYQGNVESCFAFAAADLIGFAQKFGPNKLVSAVDVEVSLFSTDPQLLWNDVRPSSDYDFAYSKFVATGIKKLEEIHKESLGRSPSERIANGGPLAMTILGYNHRKGACLESKLPSTKSIVFRNSSEFFAKRIDQLSGLGTASSYSLNWTQSSSCQSPFNSYFIQQLNDIAMKTLEETTNKACENRTDIKPMAVEAFRMERGPKALTARAIASFIGGGYPTGISYDSSFLTKGTATPQLPDEHASIVVGTRWNASNHQCEFKIRNSWGPSCELYHAPFNDREHCDAGNIWVSQNDINARVQVVTGVFVPDQTKK